MMIDIFMCEICNMHDVLAWETSAMSIISQLLPLTRASGQGLYMHNVNCMLFDETMGLLVK